MNVLNRPDLAVARDYFADACSASRAHSRLTNEALETFGDHGSLISGIVREHFPISVKTDLRILARAITRASEQAYAARPKGVRMATMRALSRAVAKRDGSGFYGPRA